MLSKVSRALGDPDSPHYSGSHYDLIYDQPYPYHHVDVYSQGCPGLDN